MRQWLLIGSFAVQVAFGADFAFYQNKVTRLGYPKLPPNILNKVAVKSPTNFPRFSANWWLELVGLSPEAHAQNMTPSICKNEIVVAVIDTGLDYTHPDLQSSVWVNPGEIGPWTPPKGVETTCRDKSCNGIDDDNNGHADDVVGWDFVYNIPLPYDTHGHGTHVSGIVEQVVQSSPMEGDCKRVAIMPLKYYDNGGAGFNNLSNTVRAIHYAIRMGANIINYSGGGAEPAIAERLALEEAQKHGILVVAAAGNDSHNNNERPYYPASYPLDNIIGVASVNKQNQLLPSSNYGAVVQLAAPGHMIQSTLPDGKYGPMSGTSQATAFVTGAAAVAALASGEKFEYKKIKNILLENTHAMKLNERKQIVAAGVVDVGNILTSLKKRALPPAEVAVKSPPSKRIPQ